MSDKKRSNFDKAMALFVSIPLGLAGGMAGAQTRTGGTVSIRVGGRATPVSGRISSGIRAGRMGVRIGVSLDEKSDLVSIEDSFGRDFGKGDFGELDGAEADEPGR